MELTSRKQSKSSISTPKKLNSPVLCVQKTAWNAYQGSNQNRLIIQHLFVRMIIAFFNSHMIANSIR